MTRRRILIRLMISYSVLFNLFIFQEPQRQMHCINYLYLTIPLRRMLLYLLVLFVLYCVVLMSQRSRFFYCNSLQFHDSSSLHNPKFDTQEPNGLNISQNTRTGSHLRPSNLSLQCRDQENVNVPSLSWPTPDPESSESGDGFLRGAPPTPRSISSRYKTELCRPFMETGNCRYGEKCQFAHGAVEQRAIERHPKYKTEACRTFYKEGFCPYGSRCHFVHEEKESRDDAAITPMLGSQSDGSDGGSNPSTPLTIRAPLHITQASSSNSPMMRGRPPPLSSVKTGSPRVRQGRTPSSPGGRPLSHNGILGSSVVPGPAHTSSVPSGGASSKPIAPGHQYGRRMSADAIGGFRGHFNSAPGSQSPRKSRGTSVEIFDSSFTDWMQSADRRSGHSGNFHTHLSRSQSNGDESLQNFFHTPPGLPLFLPQSSASTTAKAAEKKLNLDSIIDEVAKLAMTPGTPHSDSVQQHIPPIGVNPWPLGGVR